MAAALETKVLIIGSGGREDALLWSLRKSPLVGEIFVAPGNGGTERFPDTRRIHLDPNNTTEVVQAAKDLRAELVVVGPENPLILGAADRLRAEEIAVYGPEAAGANLEGSKADAAQFMREFGIPHPPTAIFDDFTSAAVFANNTSWWQKGGIVVKADGPASGKGVFVCGSRDKAHEALEKIMIRKEFGDSGKRVVIQERIKGYEVSVMAIVSEDSYILLPPSEDHKPVFDQDAGPNTGGMGVLAPHPLVNGNVMRQIEETIIKRTLNGLGKRGLNFRGTLYPGIMVTSQGPIVLEYNVRFGDPETEAIVPLLERNLFPVLQDAAAGKVLSDYGCSVKDGYCVAVTLAAGGYPGNYEKGKEIFGLKSTGGRDEVIVFHAGTSRREDGAYVSSGGRVLIVTGIGDSIENAREKAYGAIGPAGVHFEGMHYRKDIGARKRDI